MPSTSPAARTIALRLIAHAPSPENRANAPADSLAAIEWVERALAAGLSRAFGPFGYHAVLTRALAEAARAHSALSAVRVRGPGDPALEGLPEASRVHGVDAAIEAAVAVLAGVVDILSRLIGEDMAVSLMEQAVLSSPSPSAAARAPKEESSS